MFDHRCSLKATACPVWSKVVVAQPVTLVRSSRSTSRSECAACLRSTVWARRLSSARGWPSLTPSTGEKKTHANTSSAWQPSAASELILSKDQLYEMFQQILGIKKFEHQLLYNACQVRTGHLSKSVHCQGSAHLFLLHDMENIEIYDYLSLVLAL